MARGEGEGEGGDERRGGREKRVYGSHRYVCTEGMTKRH